MKKLLALVLTLTLGILLIISLNSNMAFPKYGKVNVSKRVSEKYILKNVTGDNKGIIYNESKNTESGSSNIVTSIVLDYRSFDTLGEVTVLFISALGVALVLNTKGRRIKLGYKPNFMLRVGSKALFGIILMLGFFVSTHGHLTPGGGFPGGSIIAIAFLLLYISDENYRVKINRFKILEGLAGSAYVVVGLLGLVITGYFLKNFLGTGIVGQVFSAGVIPMIYVVIGIKVGAEISGIIDDFLCEEGI